MKVIEEKKEYNISLSLVALMELCTNLQKLLAPDLEIHVSSVCHTSFSST
jgi:hypothetical protein